MKCNKRHLVKWFSDFDSLRVDLPLRSSSLERTTKKGHQPRVRCFLILRFFYIDCPSLWKVLTGLFKRLYYNNSIGCLVDDLYNSERL